MHTGASSAEYGPGMTEKDHPQQIRARKIVSRAEAMADADDFEAGLALLHRKRESFSSVPPTFDAAIARLSLLAGKPEDAIDYLARAQAAGGGILAPAARLTLADALLHSGQAEAAGCELSALQEAGERISRRAHTAALEAYRVRAGNDLDSGPPTPWRVLAQAEHLAEMKDQIAAPRLLAAHRGRWKEVPEAYDAALCRLSLRCGDPQAGIAILTRVRDEAAGGVPALIHQSLGTLLYNAGESEAGLQELSLAIDGGAVITRARLLTAVGHYRNALGRGEPIDTSFPKGLTLVDTERKLVYLSLPKNACSLLKTTFVMNGSHRDTYLAGRSAIHDFCTKLTAAPLDREAIKGADYFRFVVLREPMRRVLSAYLEKFVRKRGMPGPPMREQQMGKTIRGAQALAGVPYDPKRSISFEEFVRYLATVSDEECNSHWMPQSRSVGTDLSLYNHVGKVERLKETLELLQTRFGFVEVTLTRRDMPHLKRHVAKFSETSLLKNPHRALPHELDEFEEGLPVPDEFFPPHVRELLQLRYAADVAIYTRA